MICSAKLNSVKTIILKKNKDSYVKTNVKREIKLNESFLTESVNHLNNFLRLQLPK